MSELIKKEREIDWARVAGVGESRSRRVGMRENWYDLAGAIYLANLDWADPLSISKL